MAALVHFSKIDTTARTTSSTTAVELTNYTILWSDLTTAGFAAGDNVVILLGVRVTDTSNTNSNNLLQVGFGTTYAGRVDDTTASQRNEGSSNAGEQVLWVRKRVLVSNEDIYFSGSSTAGTATFTGFNCLILNWDDLPSTDKLYAEITNHSGDSPTTYTTGASTTTPAAGDWWLVATQRALIDSLTADLFLAIHDGTADVAEIRTEGEDTGDVRVIGTMAAKALGSGVTVSARYRTDTSATHDAQSTAIFGLRLDAFADNWFAHTTNTVTHTVSVTPQNFATNAAFGLSATGPMVVIGWPIHAVTAANHRPYGKIQIDSADWPAAFGSAQNAATSDNGTSSRVAPLVYGYGSVAAGTLDIDVQCAANITVSPNYSCVEQVAVAFSLELASGVVDATLTPAVGTASTAGLAPTVSASVGLQPLVGGAGTVGVVPTVAASIALTVPTGAAATAGAAPTISVGSALVPAVGVTTAAGQAPTVSTGSGLAPAVGAASTAGHAPTFAAHYNAAPAAGVIATIGVAPTVAADASLAPDAGAVATAGEAPTVAADHDATPEVGGVAAAGSAPTISIGSDLTPAAGSIAVQGYAPAFATAGDFAGSPTTGGVSVAGHAATFAGDHAAAPLLGTVIVEQAPRFRPLVVAGATLEPAAGAVAVLGNAPSVQVGGDLSSAPVTGSVATAGAAPNVSASAVLAPAAGSITVAGQVPTFAAHYTAEPAAGAVTVAGAAPTTAAGFGASPATGNVAVLGFAPAFAAAGDVAAAPPTGAVSTVGSAPTIAINANLTPATGGVAAAGAAPAFTGHYSGAPATGAVAVLGHAPIFESANNITAEPPTGAVAVQGQAPTVNVTGAVDAFPSTGAIAVVGKVSTVNAVVNLAPITGGVSTVGQAPEWAPGLNVDLLPATGAVSVIGFSPVYRVPTISANVRDRGPSAGVRDRGSSANIRDEAA